LGKFFILLYEASMETQGTLEKVKWINFWEKNRGKGKNWRMENRLGGEKPSEVLRGTLAFTTEKGLTNGVPHTLDLGREKKKTMWDLH